jgi:GNAT superfamily N-acetyltransferase
MEWLQETFDEMQDDILNKRQRCFMLCSTDETVKNDSKQGIVGFLTLTEEEKGSIYIAQCAIEAENKRRGYGARLLQHLRTIYPPGTFYWGLCRRANRPALNFYLKQGAKFMDDEEVAKKYGYDPALYTGFQFTDDIRNHTQSK